MREENRGRWSAPVAQTLFLSIAFSGCDCGGAALVKSGGILEVPDALDFGGVPIGASSALPLPIHNAGSVRLRVCASEECGPSTHVEPIGAPFKADFLELLVRGELEVEPGETRIVPVELRPVREGGAEEATLVLVHDGLNGPESQVVLRGIGVREPQPAFIVEPPSIDFGAVPIGSTLARSFTVRSTGIDPVTIDSLTVDDAVFAANASLPAVLAPGETLEVEATFTPVSAARVEGHAIVNGDLSVTLIGAGPAPMLILEPSPLDFGVHTAGCAHTEATVTARNTGMTPLMVGGARLAAPGGEYAIVSAPFPLELPPNATAELILAYTPLARGRTRAELFVDQASIEVFGEARDRVIVTDMFQQNARYEVDILLVIDDSGSMEDEQQSVGANVAQFLGAAGTAVSYQIAVTSTDVLLPFPTGLYSGGKMGRFVEVDGTRIVSSTMQDPAGALSTLVTRLGPNGAGSERGLEAMRLALSDPNRSDWNAGFLRPNAGLSVIVVSDEEDESPDSVATYAQFLRGLAANVSFSAVIVPPGVDPTCSDNGASVGQRYADLAQQMGGTVESICTQSWGTSLANVGLASFGLTSRFALTSPADPSSIAVRVDGVAFIAGWSYDAAANSIIFAAGSVPDPGASIAVDYMTSCAP